MTTPRSSDAPDRTDSAPRTLWGHWRARSAAELRRSTAQREFNQFRRQVRRDLREGRRQGETAAIVARSKLAELGVRGISRLAASLHRDPDGRDGR